MGTPSGLADESVVVGGYTFLLWVELYLSQIHIWILRFPNIHHQPLHPPHTHTPMPVTQSVTLLGNRVPADVISQHEVIGVGANPT